VLELEIAGRVLSCDAEKWDDEVARRWRRRMRSSLISCCCKVAKELLLLLAHTFNLHEELIDLQKPSCTGFTRRCLRGEAQCRFGERRADRHALRAGKRPLLEVHEGCERFVRLFVIVFVII
jgi:hypothetical protein